LDHFFLVKERSPASQEPSGSKVGEILPHLKLTKGTLREGFELPIPSTTFECKKYTIPRKSLPP
jgi:hypothetical protein